MTTNKPEVAAYRYTASRSFGKRNPKWHYQESFPHASNREVAEIGRMEELIRLSDYERLEAENERLRAERDALAAALAAQQRTQAAGVTMQQVLIAYDYATDHPHKYLRGTTNWCAAFAHSLNEQLAAAPKPPAPEQAGVPEGWRLVQVEPTPAMRLAGSRDCSARIQPDQAGEVWRAMLSAVTVPAEYAFAATSPTQQTEQPVAPEDYKIPCDVMLPPATRIKRGCSLNTLMVAMAQRESLPPAQRVFAAAMVAQKADDARDAERYRWLRTRWGRIAEAYDGDSDRLVAIREADSHFEGWDVDPISLDRAIDAALAKVGAA